MAYKKPQIVAKSAAKQSFVAGCPTRTASPYNPAVCNYWNSQCQINPAR